MPLGLGLATAPMGHTNPARAPVVYLRGAQGVEEHLGCVESRDWPTRFEIVNPGLPTRQYRVPVSGTGNRATGPGCLPQFFSVVLTQVFGAVWPNLDLSREAVVRNWELVAPHVPWPQSFTMRANPAEPGVRGIGAILFS
jgi:hypothetical protein